MRDIATFPAATFAGGCFWCLEADFSKLPGVLSAVSGYTGGHEPNPDYELVCSGESGHYEAVQVRYDPDLVDYRALVDWFWRRIDPTNSGGQFCDHGPQYRTAIFVHDAEQERQARASLAGLKSSAQLNAPVATAILPAAPFYRAEAYHQDYHKTQPQRYQSYRVGCGRDATLARLWGPEVADVLFGYVPRLPRLVEPEVELLTRLPELTVQVARREGTEPPFDNALWDEHRQGLYVDAISGAPLFSSQDKFDSGTGWPSFTRPLMPGNIITRRDTRLLAPRTEVRSWHSESHLGHVFDDGPRDPATGAHGLRYCMNSAVLRFIPLHELVGARYGRYAGLFDPEPA